MYITPLEALITFITPQRCYLCNNEASMLCEHCLEQTIEEQESRCYKCNKLTKQSQVCTSCRTGSRLRRVWWLGSYQGVTKKLIRAMKFGRKRAYARQFGEIIAKTVPFLPDDTIVVPIPTAHSRVRRRGFDQAVLIAQACARARNLKMEYLLTRVSQADQIGKSRLERMKQMQGSFKIASPKQVVTHKNILLIDDVITTGATAESAAALLREHGAQHVDAAVIARHLLG